MGLGYTTAQSNPLPRRIPSMKIAGSVAVITGGASGLGRATAERLLGSGGHVALLDLPRSPGADVAKTLGAHAFFTPCDVTSADEVTGALAETAAKFGAVHVLVNCAGIGTAEKAYGKRGPADLAAFTRTIQVNLIGTFNCIRLAAADLGDWVWTPETLGLVWPGYLMKRIELAIPPKSPGEAMRRNGQHRASNGIEVVGVHSRQGARIVLRPQTQFVLPISMMVSEIAEQSILSLHFLVAIEVAEQKHRVERVAVVVIILAEQVTLVPLKERTEEPVQVRIPRRRQAKLLAIDAVVDILLQKIQRNGFLVEIRVSAIVGREIGSQRSQRDIRGYLVVELHVHGDNVTDERGNEVIVHRVRVGLRVRRRVHEVLRTRIVVIRTYMYANLVVVVRRGHQGNAAAMVVGRTVIELVIGVVDISAVSIVVDTGSYADFVTDRTGNYRLVITRLI